MTPSDSRVVKGYRPCSKGVKKKVVFCHIDVIIFLSSVLELDHVKTLTRILQEVTIYMELLFHSEALFHGFALRMYE